MTDHTHLSEVLISARDGDLEEGRVFIPMAAPADLPMLSSYVQLVGFALRKRGGDPHKAEWSIGPSCCGEWGRPSIDRAHGLYLRFPIDWFGPPETE